MCSSLSGAVITSITVTVSAIIYMDFELLTVNVDHFPHDCTLCKRGMVFYRQIRKKVKKHID